METPYQKHETLNHHVTRHSPNGVDIIEECSDCGCRWMHNPAIGYPVTMSPVSPAEPCTTCNQPVDVHAYPADYIRLRNGRPVHLTCAGRTRDLQD